MNNELNAGLEGVIAAETTLSYIDGNDGVLLLGGYNVENLAGHTSVEDVCALLWTGELATVEQRAQLQRRLAAGRAAGYELLAHIGDALDHDDGMAALRSGLAHLRQDDPATVVGATATIAAAWWRARNGQAALAPDQHTYHAADYYRMASGRTASEATARALATYLVTVSDHGLNASTFTARTVASTGSDIVSAVVAAIGALKGPLHGGAPGPVLDMIVAIASEDRAEPWLRDRLANGERIMGMGHRVYRVRDPRAAVFETAAADLGSGRIALARHVEAEASRLLAERHPGRPLRANVEFYTAVLLDAIGLQPAQFAPTFAVGRVVGWCAHVAEQVRSGRLIRPRARYIGPPPRRRPPQRSASSS